jgi:hypothetical protein
MCCDAAPLVEPARACAGIGIRAWMNAAMIEGIGRECVQLDSSA